MKEPNITPGEWLANGRYVYAENGDTIAVVYFDTNGSGIEDADAKAISAVPEILDALVKAREAYQGIGDLEGSGANLSQIIPDIDKALEKAGVEL